MTQPNLVDELTELGRQLARTVRVVATSDEARAEARGALIAGVIVPTPWECRLSTYELRDGLRVPIEGEVAWMFPEGRKPYWRGRITRIAYEFAP